MLSIPGCEKVFLWVSLDEFEGGYESDQVYGRDVEGQPARQIDLWGIIAGDKTWRKSAHVLREMLGTEYAAKGQVGPSRMDPFSAC
jgi:hypothetical protein